MLLSLTAKQPFRQNKTLVQLHTYVTFLPMKNNCLYSIEIFLCYGELETVEIETVNRKSKWKG